MATLLKKRAVAEYSSQVIQEEPPPKRFKYILKSSGSSSSGSAFIGVLESRTGSNEVLQLLLRISETLNFHEREIPEAVEKLSLRFKVENESAVRVVILSLFADIGGLRGVNVKLVRMLINETVALLDKETSHKVRSQGLTTLLKLGKKCRKDIKVCLLLTMQAKTFLFDTSPLVKCKCFDIIGTFLPIKPQHKSKLGYNMLKIISSYVDADDARLRTSAFETLDKLHSRGLILNPSIYSKAIKCLADDSPSVRVAAIKVVWLLGTSHPERTIKNKGNPEGYRLIDDAFNNLCNCLFDSALKVRVKAVRLLGLMSAVSLHILEQTLDKKLMSNMKRKRTLHERSKMTLAQGNWDPKQKLVDDRPQEEIKENVNIMIKQGPCGAFAHGLEDEYLEVRNATVGAICRLSIAHPKFALLSQDFLVDMFNDEIEAVRLNAIHGLSKISKDIVLREDQLNIILSVLEDSSMDVREGVHRILTSCRLSTKDCLQMVVDKILDSLKKYPQDRKSVWNCFHQMGSLHAAQTLPLVPELLAIHPFFDTPEPNVDDPAYVGVLLLVFNAAKHCPTVLQLFEEKTIKHYRYLRDTMPHLVPSLPLHGNFTSSELKPVATNTQKFLQNMLKNIDTANSDSIRISLLEIAEKDLSRLAQIDRDVAGAAEFLSLFISSQLKFVNVLKNKLWYSNSTLEHQTSVVKNTIEQLLQSVLKMQYIFIGLNSQDFAAVKQLRLKLLSLLLVYVVRATNQSARALCHYFLSQVDETNKFLSEKNLPPDAFTTQIMRELSSLEETKPGTVARALLPLLHKSTPPTPPQPNAKIKLCYSVINTPAGGPDVVYKFTAGMVMGIPLDADLYNLHQTKLLRIKIRYPDQQTHLIMPRINHLRPVRFTSDSANTHRLVTTALISHQVWSDACSVDLNLALDLTDVENMLASSMRLANQLCVIDLCKPTKLQVLPKPVRRGI